MKKNKPTKEEILKAKYANDKWEPNFKGILEVMDAWAEIYHKEKLRGELKAFNNFVLKLEEEGKIPLIDSCINEYLFALESEKARLKQTLQPKEYCALSCKITDMNKLIKLLRSLKRKNDRTNK